MLMAAAPMVGGLAMKAFRSRKQKKANPGEWSQPAPLDESSSKL